MSTLLYWVFPLIGHPLPTPHPPHPQHLFQAQHQHPYIKESLHSSFHGWIILLSITPPVSYILLQRIWFNGWMIFTNKFPLSIHLLTGINLVSVSWVLQMFNQLVTADTSSADWLHFLLGWRVGFWNCKTILFLAFKEVHTASLTVTLVYTLPQTNVRVRHSHWQHLRFVF